MHNGAAETSSEHAGRIAVEHVLGIRLTREAARGIPWVDYSADSDANGFEVKVVTPEEYRSLHYELHTAPSLESKVLTRRWWVMVELPTMYDKFRPLPDFPPDPDETSVARLSEVGLRIQRRDARVAEWRTRFNGGPNPVPRIRGLVGRLEPELEILEADGIENTRGARPTSREAMRALRRISVMTGDAICTSHEPFPDGAPGIELHASLGYVREGPDTLAFRVQAWLASPLSSNLRESLKNGAWQRRHAVLIFDLSEPEFASVNEAEATFEPRVPVELPECVDELWCVLGRTILRFSRADGWRGYRHTVTT